MAKGLDVSEKADLWVPVVLALAAVLLGAWNFHQGAALAGGIALAIGLLGAVACLPIRLREGQRRMVAFGTGVGLLLLGTLPVLSPDPLSALAWVIAALAFLWPMPRLALSYRASMLGVASVSALLGVVAFVGVLPRPLTWILLAIAFHLAAQVWNTRPRREPAPEPGPRICLMGGSFDPFHRGHRVLAEAALKVVDRLLVVPAGIPPHKQEGHPLSPFHHRFAMARLGVEGLPRTEVLELEGRRPGPSYTVDTLDVLRTSFPAGARFLVLVGADMYQDVPTWHDWERIVGSATLLVAARPGWDVDPPPEFEGRGIAVERLQAPLVDVSSTTLRERLAAGESVGDLVSPAVGAYVRDHHLYEEA